MQNKKAIKKILIDALVDSTPDQEVVRSKIEDKNFWNLPFETIFQELGIESLGRIWFLTILEEQLGLQIDDPESFFKENANKTLADITDIFSTIMEP
jgi:acyl carrier protein